MKPIPPHLSFEQALKRGYVGRMENRQYMDWVKSLPCCSCQRPADDPHHPTSVGLRGGGTKVPDQLAIPLCRNCHDNLHHDPKGWEEVNGEQIYHSALTLLRAFYEGRLRFE